MTDISIELLKEVQRLQDEVLKLQQPLPVQINKSTLYAKKAAVMASLHRVPESGKHQQGWKYSTSEDVKDPTRAAMAEAGLSLAFELIDYEMIREEKRMIITGRVMFTLQCSESGATETSIIPAEAVDWVKGGGATAEKTFFKLYTTAQKYFLKTTFLISSGEELDSDGEAGERLSKNHERNCASSSGPIDVKVLSWQEDSPPMDKFISIATKAFKLEKADILDELKAAGYSGYKSSCATEMWEALEKARDQLTLTPAELADDREEEVSVETQALIDSGIDEADEPPF